MIGIEKYLLVKIKGIVTVKAGVEVEKAWYTDLPFLVHNVGKGIYCSSFACAYFLVLKFDIFLVVKRRITLVAVKCLFIGLIDLPNYHRHNGVFFFLNGKVRTRLATFEKQLLAFQLCCNENFRIRASRFHLPYIQVASIRKIISFHKIVSFQRITLLPP